MRSKLTSAVLLVVLTLAGVVYTITSGNEALLGLDLQGGVSVVLKPVEKVDEETLDQTVEIIRGRVDGLGVAEPEISRQGDNIVVDLPGVEEQQRALALVGQTAELRFRPVIIGPIEMSFFAATAAAAEEAGEDEAAEDATSDEDAASALTTAQQAAIDACEGGVVYPPEADVAEEYVVLQTEAGELYCLGPTVLKGDALESADPGFNGLIWTVNPTFKAGAEGIDAFNAIAAICNQPSLGTNSEICPAQSGTTGSGALAIVLDHEVLSAPSINASSFSRDQVTISGSFDEDGARNLALALNYGALPVELEAQQTRTVSAAIGDDVLRSGVTAGLIGLVLVAVYVLAYYRLAGLVALGGLVLSGLMLWTVVAWFGETQGLAITLAGIVGLIVSIGVSADSNIVYFENVKDMVAGGKRVTTSVERAYESAISTILKADTVSLIAAVLLYFLTVGAVRGFAFYLGLATLLDLLVSYMFMRPALAWLANSQRVKDNPRLLGMPAGEER